MPNEPPCLQRSSGANPSANYKLIHPPEFTHCRYLIWKRAIMFWRELYSYAPESHIANSIGLTATALLRKVMIMFIKETNGETEKRTLADLCRILDQHYEPTDKEIELNALDRWMEYRLPPRRFDTDVLVALRNAAPKTGPRTQQSGRRNYLSPRIARSTVQPSSEAHRTHGS